MKLHMKHPKIICGWSGDPNRTAYGAPSDPLVGWGGGHIAPSTLFFHSYYKPTLGYSVPFLTFVR